MNNACSPAKGTVFDFILGLSIVNRTKEKIKEPQNNNRKLTVGKLTASTPKKRKSPKPIASFNFLFITNFTYPNRISISKSSMLKFSIKLNKNIVVN